jgi:type VI secretion system protein ImpK
MALQHKEKIDDNLLETQFRAFFDEVSKVQSRSLDSTDVTPDQIAQHFSKHLVGLIELQTLESKREGNRFELESIAEARYLKAALADEVLLTVPWVGRGSWTEHLLEASLFRTSIAGERIFERIDHLLSSREPSLRPMAGLYLSALALGFQGKYRGAKDDGRFAGLKQELFQFVFQRRADLSGRDRVLSDRAYASTLSHIEPRKMPSLSRTTVAVLLTFLGLLSISEILWLWQSWPVRQTLQYSGAPTIGQAK